MHPPNSKELGVAVGHEVCVDRSCVTLYVNRLMGYWDHINIVCPHAIQYYDLSALSAYEPNLVSGLPTHPFSITDMTLSASGIMCPPQPWPHQPKMIGFRMRGKLVMIDMN